MKTNEFALILTAVLLNASAQLFLKAGAMEMRAVELHWSNSTAVAAHFLQNGPVLAGLCCYGISVILWILALTRVAVSVAYPMLSLGYVVNAFGAWWIFGENITFLRFTGMLVIGLGTWLVARG